MSAVQCLALACRHHGISVSADHLVDEYALGDTPPDDHKMRRMASDLGMKSRRQRLDWKRLCRLGKAYPVIARLDNGNRVLVAGAQISDRGEERVAVVDPLHEQQGFLLLPRLEFERLWSGEALLLKRAFRLTDEDRPFDLRWFVPELWRQRRHLVDVALAALFLHAIALATPVYFQVVLDKVLVHQSYSTLNVLGVGILLALVFDAVLLWLRQYLLLFTTTRMDVRVATRTFRHLLNLPQGFFEQSTAGVLTKHMQQAGTVRQFLTGGLFLTLLDASALLVFIPALLLYSVDLTVLVLGVTALMGLMILGLLPAYRARLHALYQAEGGRQAMLVETLQGMKTVKSLSLEAGQRRQWDERSARTGSLHFRLSKITLSAQTLSKFLEKLMSVGIIWLGAHLVFAGEISIGALVAFNMLAGRVSAPMVQLVGLIHEYQEAALSVKMLGSVMNHPQEDIRRLGGLRPPVRGQIELQQVGFRYSPQGAAVLDGIDMELPAGATIGLVGPSGSGKSTLTRLLQAIDRPQCGVIRVDGIDLREWDIGYLRRHIGVVLQENFLFRGSVAYNIAAARPGASGEAIHRAAEQAGANEFIEKLPLGFDTLLEENAANLSGGQKQRLAIARALLMDPEILILDEATSALDPESETVVKANLRKLAAGRTVLMISHRLSMVREADRIYVLDAGHVVGAGRHEQLLRTVRCTQGCGGSR